jgi:hypothetical protein
MKMEAEKDDRTHGFLDAAVRMRTTENADPRLMEVMKLCPFTGVPSGADWNW